MKKIPEKIGIYGGTFDPPHFGHVIAVKEARRGLGLDRVVVIPANIPPHKQRESAVYVEQRLEMTRLAFKNVEFVEVSDLEIRREGASYTADTLDELREIYPDDEFYLLMGTDMFLTVQNWRNVEEIFARCKICGLSREQNQTAEMKAHGAFLFERYGAEYEVIENPVVEISSTELREILKDGGESIFLPTEVLEYIKKEGLYSDN